MLFGIQLQGRTSLSFWPLRILFAVEWFSRCLCITGLTELLWFVSGWFVCCSFILFTVKNLSLTRKILLRVIVAEKQLAPWSPRNNSKLIPCNWEQKRLFSFWLAAELRAAHFSRRWCSLHWAPICVYTAVTNISLDLAPRVHGPVRQQSCVLRCHYLT